MYYKLTTNEYSLEFEANQELFDYLGFAERENKNRNGRERERGIKRYKRP